MIVSHIASVLWNSSLCSKHAHEYVRVQTHSGHITLNQLWTRDLDPSLQGTALKVYNILIVYVSWGLWSFIPILLYIVNIIQSSSAPCYRFPCSNPGYNGTLDPRSSHASRRRPVPGDWEHNTSKCLSLDRLWNWTVRASSFSGVHELFAQRWDQEGQ